MTASAPVSLHSARRAGAAALTAVALAWAVGCTRDEAGTSTTAATSPPAPTAASSAPAAPTSLPGTSSGTPSGTTPTTPPPTPAPPPPPASTVPLDAAVTLAMALDALGAGYHFVTTATVGGNVAVTAEGDHIAGATHMAIASGGTTTEYLVTADAAWALADGAWQQLDSTQGVSDPVTQLRSPTSVAVVGSTDAATITATYPNAALGLAGDGEAAVEFQLAGGQITSLRYASAAIVTNADGSTSEQPADVTAVITPIAPGTQITLPAADA